MQIWDTGMALFWIIVSRILFSDANTWDLILLAGQDRFDTLGRIFYRGTDACVFVYDVTNPQSLENIKKWKQAYLEALPDGRDDHTVFAVFGNKVWQKRLLSFPFSPSTLHLRLHVNRLTWNGRGPYHRSKAKSGAAPMGICPTTRWAPRMVRMWRKPSPFWSRRRWPEPTLDQMWTSATWAASTCTAEKSQARAERYAATIETIKERKNEMKWKWNRERPSAISCQPVKIINKWILAIRELLSCETAWCDFLEMVLNFMCSSETPSSLWYSIYNPPPFGKLFAPR